MFISQTRNMGSLITHHQKNQNYGKLKVFHMLYRFLKFSLFSVIIINSHRVETIKYEYNKKFLMHYENETNSTYLGLISFSVEDSSESENLKTKLIIRKCNKTPDSDKGSISFFLENSKFDYRSLSTFYRISLFGFMKSMKEDYLYFEGSFDLKYFNLEKVKDEIEKNESGIKKSIYSLDSTRALDKIIEGKLKTELGSEPTFQIVFGCESKPEKGEEYWKKINNLQIVLTLNDSNKLVLPEIYTPEEIKSFLISISELEKRKINDSKDNYEGEIDSEIKGETSDTGDTNKNDKDDDNEKDENDGKDNTIKKFHYKVLILTILIIFLICMFSFRIYRRFQDDKKVNLKKRAF